MRGATWLLVAAVFGAAVAGSGLNEAGGDDGDAPDAPAVADGGARLSHTLVRPDQQVRWLGGTADPAAGRLRTDSASHQGRRWTKSATVLPGKRWLDTAAGPLPGKRWSTTASTVLSGKRWSDSARVDSSGKRWLAPG